MLGIASLAATAAALGVAASGSAQSGPAQTLTLFESSKAGAFHFIDNPPKSTRRQVVSVGDEVVFSNPVLDHQGGARVGTSYVSAVFVKGTRVGNAVGIARGVLKLGDGDLVVEGWFRATDAAHTDTLAVIGGTGRYAGAHGQLKTEQTRAGAKDTVELLP
jgi:hypothetical protein